MTWSYGLDCMSMHVSEQDSNITDVLVAFAAHSQLEQRTYCHLLYRSFQCVFFLCLTGGLSEDVPTQQGYTQSPLHAGKRVDDQSNADAQSMHVQRISSSSQSSHEDSDSVGSKDVSSSTHADVVKPGQQDSVAAASISGAASPSKYPDTRLYQFADIELAHGH